MVYLVLDDFGSIGQAYREADPGGDNEAYVIHNLLTAQYSRPQRVVAFSVAEGWARDVTCEVARKVIDRTTANGAVLPNTTRELVERATEADVPAEVRGLAMRNDERRIEQIGAHHPLGRSVRAR